MKRIFLLTVFLLILVYSVKCAEFCERYYTGAGNYNSSKYCSGSTQYCCGNCTYRYCCKDRLQQLNQTVCTNDFYYSSSSSSSGVWIWIVFGVVPLALLFCFSLYVFMTRILVRDRMARENGTTSASQQPTTNITTSAIQQATTVITPSDNNSSLNNRSIYQIKYQPENSANFSESDPPNYWSAVSGIPEYKPDAETNKPTPD